MRYLRAFEHVIFGESYLGYLGLDPAPALAGLVVFHRFLPARWALVLALIVRRDPGRRAVRHEPRALRQMGGARLRRSGGLCSLSRWLAYFCSALRRRTVRDRFGPACAAGLLFALAVFVRPNLAPVTGILLAGAGLAALWQAQCRRLAGLCVGFLPVLGMALHNWVYGGVLVLFTSYQRGRAVDAAAAYRGGSCRTAASRFRRRACCARA